VNWPMVSLGDVAEIQGGIQKQPKRSPQRNAFPFLRVANVTAHGLNLKEIHAIELFDGELERYRLRQGDLLVVEGNGSASQIGRAAVWDGSIKDAVHQNHLIRVRPGCLLNERFLSLFWNSPSNRAELARIASSTSGLHTLSVAKLKRIMLPLPPPNQQRRIIEILEDHLSRLDAAVSGVAAAARRTEIWHSQVLNELVWSNGYPRVAVGGLLRERMRNGRSDRAAADSEIGTRALTLTAVTKNAFTEENTKQTITTAERAAGLWLEPGDIFVQRANTPELVGTTARYSGKREWAIFPDLLIRLRPDENKIDGRFLTAALRSEAGHNQLRRMAKGLAGSMPKIDQTAVASVTVPLPELDEQRRIIERIELTADAADNQRSALARTNNRVASLRRSLLAAAFSGRLTGTPPELPEPDEKISM
jgi:type I restriction enzyme S subunit